MSGLVGQSADYKPYRSVKMLTPVWTITCYVRSNVEKLDHVASVFSLTFVVFRITAPSKGAVEGMVALHTKNCELLMSEAVFTPFDENSL